MSETNPLREAPKDIAALEQIDEFKDGDLVAIQRPGTRGVKKGLGSQLAEPSRRAAEQAVTASNEAKARAEGASQVAASALEMAKGADGKADAAVASSGEALRESRSAGRTAEKASSDVAAIAPLNDLLNLADHLRYGPNLARPDYASAVGQPVSRDGVARFMGTNRTDGERAVAFATIDAHGLPHSFGAVVESYIGSHDAPPSSVDVSLEIKRVDDGAVVAPKATQTVALTEASRAPRGRGARVKFDAIIPAGTLTGAPVAVVVLVTVTPPKNGHPSILYEPTLTRTEVAQPWTFYGGHLPALVNVIGVDPGEEEPTPPDGEMPQPAPPPGDGIPSAASDTPTDLSDDAERARFEMVFTQGPRLETSYQ